MIKKRLILFLITVLCLSTASLEVWARNIDDVRRRQTEVEESIRSTNRQLVNTRDQIRAETAELHALESEMAEAVDVLENVLMELEMTQARLDIAEVELEEAKDHRDRQFEAFVQRSRYIYMNGWTGYIDAVLGADNFTDLLNRIDHVNRIVEFDRNLVRELIKTEENIALIVENTQKQRDDLAVLEVMNTNIVRRHDEAMAQKVSIISNLEQDAATQQRTLEAERATAAEIKRIIDAHNEEQRRIEAQAAARRQTPAAPSNQPTQISGDGNTLQWPLPGRSVNSGYGNRSDPFTRRTDFHTGVDIPAPLGTNIFAADGGTVIFSGWQGGFGNIVIIDHGRGMTTLYAHASSLLVRQGETVRRGQVIARVGSTGRSTGNHLHFEVRVNNQHTNPMNFTSVS